MWKSDAYSAMGSGKVLTPFMLEALSPLSDEQLRPYHKEIEKALQAIASNFNKDEYPTYYEIRGVTVHGRAEPVDDPQLTRRVGLDGADLQIFALALDDVLSFDFAKIERKY